MPCCATAATSPPAAGRGRSRPCRPGSRRRGAGSLFPADVDEGVIDLTCAATRAPAGVVEAYERAVRPAARATSPAPATSPSGCPSCARSSPTATPPAGLPTSADQVLVTSGAVAGIGVVLRALVGHGDRVVVENPDATPTPSTPLRRGGARLVPLGAGPRRVGRRRGRAHACASAAADRRPAHPGLPQPDRRADGRRRPCDARPGPARWPAPCRSSTRPSPRSSSTDGPMPLPFAAHDPARSPWAARRSRTGAACAPGWVRAPRTALAGAGRVAGHHRPRRAGARAAGAARADAGRPGPHPRSGATTCARRATRWCRPAACACPSCASGCRAAGCSCGASCPTASTRAASRWRPRTRGCSSRRGPRFAVIGGLDRWVRLPYVLAAGGDDRGRGAPGPGRARRAGGPSRPAAPRRRAGRSWPGRRASRRSCA